MTTHKTSKYIFNWRTAPRSIKVLLSWFPTFYKFRKYNYNQTSLNKFKHEGFHKNVIYPTRRKITYDFEQSHDYKDKFLELPYDDFINGRQDDKKDKESRVRQVVTAAAQYGFMDPQTAQLTPVAERVIDGTFRAEDFLVQLLKMYVVVNPGEEGVFPFRTVLKLIDKFKYLSRNEMTFIFGTLHDSDIENTYNAVHEFREQYDALPSKNNSHDVNKLLTKVWNKYFHEISSKTLLGTVKIDYTDALTRALKYTELFYDHGRGTATKIRVRKYNQNKFDMLVRDFKFVRPPHKKGQYIASRNDIDWFGKVDNISLPWDRRDNRIKIVLEKINYAKNKFKDMPNPAITESQLVDIESKVKLASTSLVDIKDFDEQLDRAISAFTEDQYIQVGSQTVENRQNIIERFTAIQHNADDAAMWLEVNTWKALVSIIGNNKKVIHNFNMNPDLTPKSFAPGKDNTPDIEVYFDDSLLLVEVTLMTGVQQWEHEASSVVNHVYHKIQSDCGRQVKGIFIANSMNIRTIWQLFLLNRESWIGEPIPIAPLKISEFKEIIDYMYKNKVDIFSFNELMTALINITGKLDNFEQWQSKIDQTIKQWKSNRGRIIAE